MLTLYSNDMTLFTAVEKAKMILPDDDACFAWGNLINTFIPTTNTFEIDLTKELTASRLGKQTLDE